MKAVLASIMLGLACASAQAGDLSIAAAVEQAMWGEHRSEANTARNRYRHPVGTLDFFRLSRQMRVLEIWPGAGWYTEVLAPVLREHGKLVVATWDPAVEGQPDYRYELPKRMAEKFAANPEVYDQVETVYYSPPESASLGDAESFDMVMTFRNTHGWVNSGMAGDIYKEFARVLKPGGLLGVVQHRAANGTDPAKTAPSGYVSEEKVIALAAEVGLVMIGKSEVNANPMDSHDHPEGVWTLPPSLRLGEEDRKKYLAIGESDRMTLLFTKRATR